MTSVRAGIAASLVLCLLALASCGGDGESTATEPPGDTRAVSTAPSAAVVVAANRNCARMLRDVTQVGREAAQTNYETARELTTKGFAEPGMRLIKDLAGRQRALQDDTDSPAFEAYVASFDPIVVLGEQWLQAQRKLDFERADRLQELLTNLGAEQQVLAERAGLARCSVDFLNAMVRSSTP